MFVEIYGRLTCPYCVRAKALAEKMKGELADFKRRFGTTCRKTCCNRATNLFGQSARWRLHRFPSLSESKIRY